MCIRDRCCGDLRSADLHRGRAVRGAGPPVKAVVNVQRYHFAVSQVAQTSLRSVIGQRDLDDLLAARDRVNADLRRIIDEPTEEPWGIKIERVEVKDVSLPEGMKRSMSRQAEAERERRARVSTAVPALLPPAGTWSASCPRAKRRP